MNKCLGFRIFVYTPQSNWICQHGINYYKFVETQTIRKFNVKPHIYRASYINRSIIVRFLVV